MRDITDSQIKYKSKMIKSSLCDYSDAYILVKETITATWSETDAAARWTSNIEKSSTSHWLHKQYK